MLDALRDLVDGARLQELTELFSDVTRVPCEIITGAGETLASTSRTRLGGASDAVTWVPVEADGAILGHVLAWAVPDREEHVRILSSILARGARLLVDGALARRCDS